MDERRELLGVLAGAQDRGLIGPGPLEAHIDHSRAWAVALGGPVETFLDLGSGGGLPGLVLALEWPQACGTLLDSRQLSVAWITEAAERLGLDERIEVVGERAETAGRDPELREAFPLVVARGFAAPAVTAECGSAFVAPGGRLSVSEPPEKDPARWPPDQLADLALGPVETTAVDGATFAMLEKTGVLDDRWPRRSGKPKQRPLW